MSGSSLHVWDDELAPVSPAHWHALRARLDAIQLSVRETIAIVDKLDAAGVEAFWRDIGRPADPEPDVDVDDDEDLIRLGSDFQ